MTDEDVAVCYDMSLKEFEHFVVHDLFKVCDFTFASSCHFTFFLPNKVFFLIINFFFFFNFRQCQSSSQCQGRPQRWIR